MKSKIFTLLLALFVSVLSMSSCTESEQKSYCDLCGNESTQTLSGPGEFMKSEGISLSKCRNITGNIYSISLCDACYEELDIPEATKDPILDANGFYD